ncbi:DUF4402 domain-containing protein [Altererythrobacter sp. BO-6]|uniref:DUF4402 domain-containing protein n=1 Tax=Altererythrobacter sp. BO-6 TaxID=2604537 RepID=UPI0013E1C6F6|nr:DUF4402 domain-containing protein [Altererythrobacter sp. BO-6]QIG54252.1 DUF4402 domain-containing protein [Altererythrobacter sp. BO-6]
MKKIVLAAFAAAVAFPAAAAPGDTDDATGTATAVIVAPITITNTGSGLNFGTIAPDDTASGTVTIGYTGTATPSGVVLVAGATTPSADEFTVSGEDGQAYTIDIDTDVTLTRAGGTETMTATLDAESAGDIIGDGNDVFAVGGELTVGAGQVAGSYSGTYTVTATYD